MKHTLIFIDTETTGAGPDDRLIQIGYRTTDGKDVNQLYSCGRKIEIGAMAVHHITEKMIANKPVFTDSPEYHDLKDRFEKMQVFVAHNAPFDVAMIEKEGLDVGPVIDTLKIARALDPHEKIESYAMQYLRYLLGIEVEATAHDAWGDILVLEQLFYRLLKKITEEKNITQDQAIDWMIEESKKPILYRSIRFGKYAGQKFEDIAKNDPGYLRWLLGEKEKEEIPDENWLYTLKHYLHM
ncbi:DNA polymerase III subunit epsilon [Candidatus Campbellbacteria bacterium]|nr:DNA polymerase III subunit epsilon [Candidatus Campbellbacteria bacterium]|tara:strand:- start:2125 stop:2844 length:720 start_codon:yes stop_codon:yes gene_type:complete